MEGAPSRSAALDGLRGCALVAVLGYHVWPEVFRGGFLGVDIFFVLSGYLLTDALWRGVPDRGISFTRFATRRVRRIVPGMVALLGVLVVAVPLVASDSAARLTGDAFASLFGVMNWHLIRDGGSYFAQAGRPSFTRHLWSIAVEMQFYVVCPVLVAVLVGLRRKIALALLMAGIFASALCMTMLYAAPDPSRAYFGTDTRLHGLLIGCLTAALARPPTKATTRAHALVPAVVLAAMVMLASDEARVMYPVGFLAVEVATACLIVLALRPGVARSGLSQRWLRWLGERSYGIYLWHWPIVVLVRSGLPSDWPAIPAAVAILGGGLVLGDLSYRFVETPFLHASARGRTVHPAARRVGIVAGVVVALSVLQIPTTTPLEQVLAAGDKVIAAQTLPTTTLPPTTAPAAPSADVPAVTAAAAAVHQPRVRTATPSPQPPPAVSSLPTTAVGDSVMVSAAGELHERVGDSGYIDAKQNRHFSDAAAVLASLRARGALGRAVVIHLGNNGPVSDADIDAALRETEGVQAVLLVTVRVGRPWQDSVNATLRDATARWPTVRIVDWYAASANHASWFQSDGTHFKTSSGPGANAYADLIAGALPAAAPETTTSTSTTTTTVAPPPFFDPLAPSEP